MSLPSASSQRSRLRRIIVFGASLGAGAVVGALSATLLKGTPVIDGPWADQCALVFGLGLACPGLFLVLMSLRPPSSAFAADGAVAVDLRPRLAAERTYMRLAAAGTVIGGMMLLIPVLMMALPGGGALLQRELAMTSLVLGALVQAALNLVIWRRSDELFRRVITDSAATTFWVLQAVLFLWAAAEHLHLAPPVSAWQCAVIMMGVYVCASYVVWARHGLQRFD